MCVRVCACPCGCVRDLLEASATSSGGEEGKPPRSIVGRSRAWRAWPSHRRPRIRLEAEAQGLQRASCRADCASSTPAPRSESARSARSRESEIGTHAQLGRRPLAIATGSAAPERAIARVLPRDGRPRGRRARAAGSTGCPGARLPAIRNRSLRRCACRARPVDARSCRVGREDCGVATAAGQRDTAGHGLRWTRSALHGGRARIGPKQRPGAGGRGCCWTRAVHGVGHGRQCFVRRQGAFGHGRPHRGGNAMGSQDGARMSMGGEVEEGHDRGESWAMVVRWSGATGAAARQAKL